MANRKRCFDGITLSLLLPFRSVPCYQNTIQSFVTGPKMSVRCRLATAADLVTLNQFQDGIIEAEADYIPRRQTQHYRYYDLTQLLADPDTRIVVAEREEQPVGSGYVQKRPSKAYLDHAHHGYIGFMYTRPECRGQGIAKSVLAALKAEAKDMGLDELRLDVFADNRVAITTYETAGFTPNLLEMRYAL